MTAFRPSAIWIWSPDHTGHHFLYARFIAQYAITASIPVSIYSTALGFSSREFDLHLGGLDLTRAATNSLKATLASMPENGLLVICHVDRVMVRLLLAKVPRWAHISALIMRPSRTMQGNSKRIAKAALTLCLSARPRIHVSELSTIGDRQACLIPQVPDPAVRSSPVVDKDKARASLGLPIPSDGTLGLVIGLLSARKRPELLIGALDYLPDGHHLLFAGSQDVTFKQIVESAMRTHPGRIHVINEHLSDETFGLCLNAASYVAALHSPGISSGVVLQAILIGCPIIVVAGTPLGRLIEELSLGCVTSGTNREVALAIERVLSEDRQPQSIVLPSAEEFVLSLLDPARL